MNEALRIDQLTAHLELERQKVKSLRTQNEELKETCLAIGKSAENEFTFLRARIGELEQALKVERTENDCYRASFDDPQKAEAAKDQNERLVKALEEALEEFVPAQSELYEEAKALLAERRLNRPHLLRQRLDHFGDLPN